MPKARPPKETRPLSHISRAEMETIVNFNRDDKDADVFTYEFTWQRQIEQRLGIQPYADNGFGGKSYKIPKSRISKPKAPRHVVMSAERIAKMHAGRRKAKG